MNIYSFFRQQCNNQVLCEIVSPNYLNKKIFYDIELKRIPEENGLAFIYDRKENIKFQLTQKLREK